MALFLALFLQALYVCTTTASSNFKSYDNCLCSKLFDMLADEKAKWKETNFKLLQLANKLEEFEKNPGRRLKGQNCNYPIAFYAKRDNSKIVSSKNTVDFKTVVTDTCNTYNKATSVFMCPVAGVFVFNVWILDNTDDNNSYLEIMKNNISVGFVWANSNKYHNAGGNTVVLELQKGDKIYVRVGSNHVGSVRWQYSTFSGFRLY